MPVPVFWPPPAKLKPCTVNTEATASFSLSRKCRSSFSIACIVRSWVAPTGAMHLREQDALVLGRQERGRQPQEQHAHAPTSSAAKIAMKRPLRPSMPRTPSR